MLASFSDTDEGGAVEMAVKPSASEAVPQIGAMKRKSVQNLKKMSQQLRGSVSFLPEFTTANEKETYLRYVFKKYDADGSGKLDWGEIANAMADILPRGLIKTEDLELFVRDYTAKYRQKHHGEIQLSEEDWVDFMEDIKPQMSLVLLSLIFGDMSTNLADKLGRRVIVPVFFVFVVGLILYAVTR